MEISISPLNKKKRHHLSSSTTPVLFSILGPQNFPLFRPVENCHPKRPSCSKNTHRSQVRQPQWLDTFHAILWGLWWFMMVPGNNANHHPEQPSQSTFVEICWNRTSVSRLDLMPKGCTSSNRRIPSAKQPRALPFPKIWFLKGSLLHRIFQSCHLWSYLSQESQGELVSVSEDFGDWSHSSQSLQAQYLDQSSARIPNQTSDYQLSANQTFENKSMSCFVTWSTSFAVLALVHVSKLHREDSILTTPKRKQVQNSFKKQHFHESSIMTWFQSTPPSVFIPSYTSFCWLYSEGFSPTPHPIPSSRQQHDHAHFIWQVLLGLASFKRSIIITGPSAVWRSSLFKP